MLESEHLMRVLIDRLNWPIRLVRWQTAQKIAGLFSSSEGKLARRIFLDWLQSRQMETEVLAGLAVLVCTKPKDLPAAANVKISVKKPSILADLLFQRIYRKPMGGWLQGHSGIAPVDYTIERYFEEHLRKDIPPILSSEFKGLEDETSLPFMRQWAFEWRSVMDATNAPYSSYPHYFMNKARSREGVSGQFSQSQCNVYRSSFLRTLSLAVSEWQMPRDRAVILAARCCLPLNKGLHALQPIARPGWLKNLPERCCKPDARIEELVRKILGAKTRSGGMRPVSLRIPINSSIVPFGELSIEAFYATRDFVPHSDFAVHHTKSSFWWIDDLISFAGSLEKEEVEKFKIAGATGFCIPVCPDAWPSSFGFWQNDYAHLGFAFPASYNFGEPARVGAEKGQINFTSAGKRVGYWKAWHDNWSPIHAVDGHTRCGGLTELATSVVAEAQTRLKMDLIWQAQLNLWERTTEYGAPKLSTRSLFFKDL